MGNHEAFTVEYLSETARTSSVIMGNHEAYTIEYLSETASTSSVIMGNHERDNIATIPPPNKAVESLLNDRIEPIVPRQRAMDHLLSRRGARAGDTGGQPHGRWIARPAGSAPGP